MQRVNTIVRMFLNKMISAHKTNWDRKLPSAIHSYITSEKRTTGKSHFFLMFRQGVVYGVELEIESLRVMAYR